MQYPDADGAALLDHSFRPRPSLFANQPGAIQQVIQIMLNDVPKRGMLVQWVGGELAWFGPGVQGDLFPALTK